MSIFLYKNIHIDHALPYYISANQALNEMNASNSTLEELESAAHRALAEFMVMSTPQMELSDRIHKMEEQIPAIEKYHEFVAYHKKYTSLEGKAKTKYKSDFCYELDEYHKAYKKLIELFPDGHIPKLSKLKTELEKAQTDYAQQSAERKALKKEADRLSRLAQQKRDSQRTLARNLPHSRPSLRSGNFYLPEKKKPSEMLTEHFRRLRVDILIENFKKSSSVKIIITRSSSDPHFPSALHRRMPV